MAMMATILRRREAQLEVRDLRAEFTGQTTTEIVHGDGPPNRSSLASAAHPNPS
jgi:hypothetical protein